MSEEKGNDERRVVTSVGNSWIVCKSKSHPGHVYYFNSLTGEAAWNLSDAEIEKAKARTKNLEGLPGGKLTKCPEPKDKPPSIPLSISQPAQTLSSEQILINRTEQSSLLTYSNIAKNNATFCSPFNQISGAMQHNQITNSSLIKPVCNLNPFNNSLGAYNVNTAPTLYNPKVWDVPQTQQVFIAPPISPVANHSLGSLNIGYNHLVQTVSQPTTGLVFNSFNNGETQQLFPRGFNYDSSVKGPKNKNVGFTNKRGLRQKLSFKNNKNNISSIPRGSGVLKANLRKSDIATHIHSKIEENYSKKFSTGMESRYLETQVHETPSKIDLGPLKRMSPSDANSDAWFIVVDLEVLLHEFKFLTTLTDSDEKCHLMVPKRVMDELKSYVICVENIQAKRILRFLSQQIEIGYAHMAEKPSNVADDSMAEEIYSTCTELLDGNYHLILLTNDNELLSKCSSDINVFCIDDIKNLLMKNSNKQPVLSGPKKPFLSNELLNKIKITVPNNAPQNTDTTCSATDYKSDNIPITPPKQNNTPEKKEELIVSKCTVDAGIQTDMEDIVANISINKVVDKQTLTAVSNSPPQNTKETITKRSVSLSIPGRREIKLKRSISHQSPVNTAESKNKQSKWRRKTNTTLQVNEQIISNNDNMNTTIVESQQTNTVNNAISKLPDQTLNNNSTLGSRESSIYAYPKSCTIKENVIIEETSTSGIISNTESNVDVESTYSTSSINQQLVYTGQSSKPMYKVDSNTMEQSLRVKFDEWISRFIQIMEEVLSQVLQQEPSFKHTAMPPPWTLYEAVQCIAVKFCSHESIIAETNKLSEILMQVSDDKGKISINMTPYQYMEMYSYGVHLLAAIMESTNNCEDIQIAVKSLTKLLHDIRNPNIESSTNDAFNDSKHGNSSKNDATVSSDVPDNSDSLHVQEMSPGCTRIEETRKGDPKETESSEELQEPVKFIRNIDIPFSFLKSDLQKTNTLNKVKSPVQSRENQNTTSSQIDRNNSQNANDTTEKGTDSDVPTYQSNIIRKFSKCPELEAKLKINHNMEIHEDHDDNFDNNESDSESKKGYYYREDEDHREELHYSNGNQTDEEADPNENYDVPESLNDFDSNLSDENNNKFKFMMCILLQEVRDALNQVRILCDQCYKELENPKQSAELKNQLQEKAESAHLYTMRLCRSLQSMLDHEAQSVSDLLKQVDIDIHHVDAELLLQYRSTVANCKDHAAVFVSSIKNIISDFKKHKGKS